MKYSPAALIAAASLSVSFAAPRVAHACTPLQCAPGVQAPSSTNPQFPANAAAFLVTNDRVTSSEIRTADGTVVPSSVKEISGKKQLVPDAPLTAEKDYELRYDKQCVSFSPEVDAGGNQTPQPAVFKFHTSAVASAPATTGTLRIVDRGSEPGSSTASFVRVTLDMSATLLPYRDLTKVEFEVDGRPMYDFGTPGTAPSAGTITVGASCPTSGDGWAQDSCGTFGAVPAGKHTLTAKPFVLGAATQPAPVSIEIDVACGTVTDADAGPVVSADGGVAPVTPNVRPEDDDGGCSVSPNGSELPWTSVGLGLAIGAMALLKRRAR